MSGTPDFRAPVAVAAILLLTAPAIAAPEALVWEADDGTTVVLVEDHRVPLVEVRIEFPVGRWSPWARDNHAAEAFEIQLYDPEGRLRSRADRLAARLGVSMQRYASRVSASCRKQELEDLLALIRDVLENRDLDRSELKRLRKNRRLSWAASQKEPSFKLRQAMTRMLHPPGDPRRRELEKPGPVETDPDRLLPVRDKIVRLPGRVIGFAGDLTREEAARLADGLLPKTSEDSPDGLDPVLAPVVREESLPGRQSVRMRRIAQVFFGYARESLTVADDDYPAFMVADHVLGGHFFSRLYVALRHEGGETYGAGTQGRGTVASEPYALTTFTRPDNASRTEKKLRDVLRSFYEEGITEDERAAAIGYLQGRRPFSRQSPAQILESSLWERRHGLPPGYRDSSTDRAARVPLEEVNAFIRRFYRPALFRMVEVAPQ